MTENQNIKSKVFSSNSLFAELIMIQNANEKIRTLEQPWSHFLFSRKNTFLVDGQIVSVDL